MDPDLPVFRAALRRANPFVTIDDDELREVILTCRTLWPTLEPQVFVQTVTDAVLGAVGADHQLPVADHGHSSQPF